MSTVLFSFCVYLIRFFTNHHSSTHIFIWPCLFPVIMFHHDVMRKKYGDNIQLLVTDTDSLMYDV